MVYLRALGRIDHPVSAFAPQAAPARPCPLCGAGGRPALVARSPDTASTPFHYDRCRACATRWLVDVPGDLGAYYPQDYYSLPAAADLPRLAASEQHKVALLCHEVAPGRLVEIGPGAGVFAFAAQAAGFDVTGIERDARCCAHLVDVVGVEAVNSTDPVAALAGRAPSRAVVLWHVIEHLPDPGPLLDAIADNLEPGGVAAIATPNPRSLQFRALGARWAHVDAPRHLTLIPLDALVARAAAAGLVLRSVTTRDPSGRHWNLFGWERALGRRLPALALTLALRPIERRGLNGAAYTAVFAREPA